MTKELVKTKLAYVTTLPVTQWRFLQGQNAYMAQRGFELHAIASPSGYVDLGQVSSRDGAIAHAVPISREIAPFADLLSLIRLIVLFARIRPDIVHLSTPKAALVGSMAAWITRVPVRIFLMRGSLSDGSHGFRKRLMLLLERLTVRLCNQHICNSYSLLKHFRSTAILGADQGIVLVNGMSNGVDTDCFDPSIDRKGEIPEELVQTLQGEDSFVIGYVGRLCRDKGISELAEAWSVLREEFPHIHLLLVGDFEKMRGVPDTVRAALEQDSRVTIVGFTDNVVPYYSLMSLFVFPSYREGFPNAPMEAAAMQLPVVVSDAVGCVDAVQDGKTGIIAPAHDAQALADAIRTYLHNPDLLKKHGQAGRERVLRDFRQETIWEALYQEYLRLLQAR